MFWYKCTIFRENKMSILKANCRWSGTLAGKYVGDAGIVFVLIKTVHLVV
jgi:hypothetical protein